MTIKVCGITSIEDAQAAVEAGATALGFNFWKRSPRYIAPERAALIIEEMPAFVWKAGVFVDEAGAELARKIGLDVVQIHGAAASPAGMRVWRAVAAGGTLDDPIAEAYLIDTPAGELRGGTGRAFDWSLARDTGRKVILAGGLDASNVRAAIAAARPWGVDACSRLESAPGKKDHQKMAAFVKAAIEASSP